MSAGVSDQRMKGQGNQVNSSNKNVETDSRTSIPWSQQVDEAYENLSSPTEGNQSGSYDSSNGGGGTQFQYPPFNAKESGAWSGNKSSSRRYSPSHNDNYDNNDGNKRTYNQSQQHSSSYNFFSRNGDTSWAAQVNAAHQQQQQQQQSNSRRSNNCNDYYNRSDRNNSQNDNFKSMQKGMQNMGLENNENRSTTGSTLSNSSTATTTTTKAKSTTQTTAVPKKMTWASIASQPAKPTLRISSTSSTLKKKGPGMPPPPMVPGKHNMDIGTWDSPKNGPILVPPSPPPVIPVPIMEPSPLSQANKSSVLSSSSNNNSNNNNDTTTSSKGNQAPSHLQNQKPSRSGGCNNQNTSDSNQSSSDTRPTNQNIRPPWISQNNPLPKSGGNEGGSRYIPTHHQYQRPNSQQHQGQGGGGPGGGGNRHESNIGDRYHRENDSENFRRGPSGNNSSLSQQQHSAYPPVVPSPTLSNSSSNHPVLEELRDKNNYNPTEIDLEKASVARFFVIKSYSEDDIHRSIKYEIWCSTEHGNKRLDDAFKERESEGGIVYLFFSVNGSGHFCGMAQMMTPVDYNSVSNVWSQDKWKGKFKVKWIYVKDVPNGQLRHIRLENNENRSVTHSRDTQEVPNSKGIQVLKILHSFRHTTSIFDDFIHYEKKQEEEDSKKYEPHPPPPPPPLPHDNRSIGNKGIYRGGDCERNAGGDSSDKGYYGGFRDRNQNRGGGYHNFENRRNDDYRYGGGSDRMQKDGPFRDGGRGEARDIGNSGGRDNRENNDFHNSRGFHRSGGGDFGRRDDRGYNNRDRDRDRDRSDNYNDGNHPGGFMSRGGGDNNIAGGRSIGGGGGGFRDNFNRDRDFHSRGRVRGGPHRN